MSPQVTTEKGVLKGKQCEDFFGRQYYSFQGIPFAKPPLEKLRFKAPLPAEPWQGVRDATSEQEGCLCYNTMFKKFAGKEDCLYLNVFTPQLPTDKDFVPKAVMVFIHGGGFISESATEAFYGPKFLITQDVVLVTITYRLGALGFLSLQDINLEVPGNAGLKDQIMGLKWVQENIKAFGGNPENVTIFGESAGGASVHYLVISPMARGLFHKAIIQSGTIFDPWARGKPTGIEICHYMNVNPKDEAETLEILQRVPALDILTAQLSIRDVISSNSIRPFVPIIEKPNKDAFLDEDPLDILIQARYNKVPIILGYNDKEGLIREFLSDVQWNCDELEKFIPHTMHIEEGSFLETYIVKKIKEFYFPNNLKVAGDPLYQLYTDSLFLRGIDKTAKYHSSTSPHPVYLYRFSMDGTLNIVKESVQATKVPGACHGDELGYLFTNDLKKEIPIDSKEYRGVMMMIRLWTNFAKMGNPNNLNGLDDMLNVEWKPAIKEEMNFLDIDFKLRCGVAPDKERMDFWDEIFKMKSCSMKY